MGMLTTALGMVSPAGEHGRLSILIFHRVLEVPDPLFPSEPDAARFDEMLGWIRAWFNVLPLDEAVRRLQEGTIPARAAAITFDDGYADNCTVALPILLRHGMKATFFVASGYLDGGCMWNDRIISAIRRADRPALDLDCIGLGSYSLSSTSERQEAIRTIVRAVKYLPADQRDDVAEQICRLLDLDPPRDLMLTGKQLLELRAHGMQIGAHTKTHPILTMLSPLDAQRQIGDSKSALEELLGERVDLFAYPNGKPQTDFRIDHVELVRELGFVAAVSTAWGAANRVTDVMQLPRFTPWDRLRAKFGMRLLRNLLRRPALA